jgi:hypothetical protein
MTLQYSRLFQLRAGISLINEEEPLTKDRLAERLRQRKSIDASETDATEGANDIINHLRQAHLITEVEGGYRLSTREELSEAVDNTVLLYSGREVLGTGDEREQADRILSNLMYQHPMLIALSKFVYRYAPVKKYEIKREFDGESFLEDKMNSFTIDMGLNLLRDAEVIQASNNEFKGNRWPIRLFAHVVHEEYFDVGGDEDSGVREPELFERLQTMYGIDRGIFDTLLTRLHNERIISEAGYGELTLNAEVLKEANIHE